MLKMSATDCGCEDHNRSRLLLNGLGLLLLHGLNNFGFSSGLEELFAFINFKGSDWGLLKLWWLADIRFSGSYIFSGGSGYFFNDFLLW
jgi:hypothetical protein